MNSKAEFFRLAGSTVVIEYKDRSIITSIKIIEFGEKTTKFILLNGDEVTIDNNQKLKNNSTLVLVKLKNMQIVAQESLIYYLRLLCKQRQMKLQKNQNLIM